MSLYPDFGVPALSPADRRVLLRGQGKHREIKDCPSKRGIGKGKRKQATPPGEDRDWSPEGKRRKINFRTKDAEVGNNNRLPKKHLRVTLQRITKPLSKWVTPKPKAKSLPNYLPSKNKLKDEESSGDVKESNISTVMESKINNTENDISEHGKQVEHNEDMFSCRELESLLQSNLVVQNEDCIPPTTDSNNLYTVINDGELDVSTILTPTTGFEDPLSTYSPSTHSIAPEKVGDLLKPGMCPAIEGMFNLTENDVLGKSKQVQNMQNFSGEDLKRIPKKIVQNINPPGTDNIDVVNEGETAFGSNLTPMGISNSTNLPKEKVVEESVGKVLKSNIGDDFLPPGYGSDKLAKVIIKVLEEKVKVTDSHSERELFRNTIHVLQCRGCKDREKHGKYKCRRCDDRDRRKDAEKKSSRNENSNLKRVDKVNKMEVGGKPRMNVDDFSSKQVSKGNIASIKSIKFHDNAERPNQAKDAQGGDMNKHFDSKTKDREKYNVGLSGSEERGRMKDAEKKLSKNNNSKKMDEINVKEVGSQHKTKDEKFGNKQFSIENKSSCKSRDSHENAELSNQSKKERGGDVNKLSGTKPKDLNKSKMQQKLSPYENDYLTPKKRAMFDTSPQPPSPGSGSGSGLVSKSILKSTKESPKSMPSTPPNVKVNPIPDQSPSSSRRDIGMSAERSLNLGTNLKSVVSSFARFQKNMTVAKELQDLVDNDNMVTNTNPSVSSIGPSECPKRNYL